MSHPKIAEAAVVGIPHNIKGRAIYAYVTPQPRRRTHARSSYTEVRNWVRKRSARLPRRTVLHWTDSLPKTRSGKIMRRILRKITPRAIPVTSVILPTLADPGVVDKLLEEKQAIAMPS